MGAKRPKSLVTFIQTNKQTNRLTDITDVYGYKRMYMDEYGYIRMYTDVYGCILIYTDIYGYIRIMTMNSEENKRFSNMSLSRKLTCFFLVSQSKK